MFFPTRGQTPNPLCEVASLGQRYKNSSCSRWCLAAHVRLLLLHSSSHFGSHSQLSPAGSHYGDGKHFWTLLDGFVLLELSRPNLSQTIGLEDISARFPWVVRFGRFLAPSSTLVFFSCSNVQKGQKGFAPLPPGLKDHWLQLGWSGLAGLGLKRAQVCRAMACVWRRRGT